MQYFVPTQKQAQMYEVLMTLDVLANIHVLNITEPVTRTELLSRMADLAIENHWAKPGFTQAVLEREAKYATGLHSPSLDVAIPHADPEWTLLPGMIVSILDRPVSFQPMGGQGDEVQAKIVFLLVIPNADAHIAFLQALASFIADKDQLSLLDRTKDINLLISYMTAAQGD